LQPLWSGIRAMAGIPASMFDPAARAAWRGGAAPYVEIAVLTALVTLLQDVTSVSGVSSQLITAPGPRRPTAKNSNQVARVTDEWLSSLKTSKH